MLPMFLDCQFLTATSVFFLAFISSYFSVYLSTTCNQKASVTTGISLQSSTALTYSNSMSCYLEVSVPTNYKVVAVFR